MSALRGGLDASAASRVNPAETLFHQIVDDRSVLRDGRAPPFMVAGFDAETLRGASRLRTAAHVGQLPRPVGALPYDAVGLQALPELSCGSTSAMPFQQFPVAAPRAQESAIHQHSIPAPASAARRQQPVVDQSAVGGRQSTVAAVDSSAVAVAVDCLDGPKGLVPTTTRVNPGLRGGPRSAR